jgi:hypothetical protein
LESGATPGCVDLLHRAIASKKDRKQIDYSIADFSGGRACGDPAAARTRAMPVGSARHNRRSGMKPNAGLQELIYKRLRPPVSCPLLPYL